MTPPVAADDVGLEDGLLVLFNKGAPLGGNNDDVATLLLEGRGGIERGMSDVEVEDGREGGTTKAADAGREDDDNGTITSKEAVAVDGRDAAVTAKGT